MQSSTVKREKLVKPLHIAIIVVVFAVAFILLAPNKQDFLVSEGVNQTDQTQPVDALDLAYLKATHIDSDKSGDELGEVARILVEGGRAEDAKDVVDANPEIVLSDSERFLLDLELAVSEWRSALGRNEGLAACITCCQEAITDV